MKHFNILTCLLPILVSFVFVYDILTASNVKFEVKKVKNELKEEFNMKDFGVAKKILRS